MNRQLLERKYIFYPADAYWFSIHMDTKGENEIVPGSNIFLGSTKNPFFLLEWVFKFLLN